ncbi:hypothetical protein E2C01_089173 [Portunus trituberculatus]|uniref:Uncharacterized protein n=1 Tax=Portunus trituberculatus TaxID=210409 RepID=A0A5B7J831_PORTR|nr:hypothetical protein [Portunus trituberculatus]
MFGAGRWPLELSDSKARLTFEHDEGKQQEQNTRDAAECHGKEVCTRRTSLATSPPYIITRLDPATPALFITSKVGVELIKVKCLPTHII